MPTTVAHPTCFARGRYAYWLNGEPLDMAETWAIYAEADGGRRIWSERVAPAFGAHIEVEAWERAGRIAQVEVQWQNSNPKAVSTAHAKYTIDESTITVSRTIHGAEQHEQLSAPPKLVVSPLMRIFQGPVIRQVAAVGHSQPVPVFVPWIIDPTDAGRLLTAHIDYRSAQAVGNPVGLDGRAAQPYHYRGGNYDDTAEFFIGEDDRLLRYTFRESAEKVWDVYLKSEE
jgi:hypothetical protein